MKSKYAGSNFDSFLKEEDILEEVGALKTENERLNNALEVAAYTLGLIASPMRPDGTYNRDRRACEQLARDALDKMEGICGGYEP